MKGHRYRHLSLNTRRLRSWTGRQRSQKVFTYFSEFYSNPAKISLNDKLGTLTTWRTSTVRHIEIHSQAPSWSLALTLSSYTFPSRHLAFTLKTAFNKACGHYRPIWSSPKLALPTPACTITPAFSTRNCDFAGPLAFFNGLRQHPASRCQASGSASGLCGPKTLPNRPTTAIISGVAIQRSNSISPF